MIPFNRPTVAPGQIDAVAQVFGSGHLSGDGEYTKRASESLRQIHGGSTVLLTTSCTDALELSALLLRIQPGDQVIVPSFTFVSSANAFAIFGADIVFVDIEPSTLNLNESQVERAITRRTRAIVAVNYAGTPAVTPTLVAMAKHHNLTIVEDNAHGLFGTDADENALGTQSNLSTLSFHETKNVTCGEGGALVINDPELVDRAEIIREKGTNRSRFFRGMVDKYTWVDFGSSYLLSEINAAVLFAQLEHRNVIQERRRQAAARYREHLNGWADAHGQSLMPRLPGCPDHLFPVLFHDPDTRTRFLQYTREKGVATTFHYIPLHSSPAGQKLGRVPFGCDEATNVSQRLARLPLFSDITDDEVQTIIDVVKGFPS
jgi:dTDP-4-amino-4,6-dideoxygalactose transaminase